MGSKGPFESISSDLLEYLLRYFRLGSLIGNSSPINTKTRLETPFQNGSTLVHNNCLAEASSLHESVSKLAERHVQYTVKLCITC